MWILIVTEVLSFLQALPYFPLCPSPRPWSRLLVLPAVVCPCPVSATAILEDGGRLCVGLRWARFLLDNLFSSLTALQWFVDSIHLSCCIF